MHSLGWLGVRNDHDFFGSAPVIGFAVDSFPDVHAAMTAAGTEFIYPEPQRAEGRAWQHFRGLDGNFYEVIGPDDQGAQQAMQTGRPRPDQRVPQSSLTIAENTSSEPLREFWHGTPGGLVT